ncbi:MAG: hypothetical protein HY329_02775 [Chloroflexi bacterium]|nr:hypothetical protein [Chloroflexota bacterium]
MSERAALLYGRMEVAPELEAGFNEWYNADYLPPRLKLPGWFTGRRFVAVRGQPKYATLYDLESTKVFANPDYVRLRQQLESTPSGSKYYAAFSNFTRNIYEQVFPNPPQTAPSAATALLAVLIDLDPAAEERFNTWAEREHFPSLAGTRGLLLARRFLAVEGGPRIAHLFDLAQVDSADALAGTESAPLEWARRAGAELRVTTFLGRRIHPPVE